ncbi:SAF domain-containing protein [Acidipropionibacterium virtanenii]
MTRDVARGEQLRSGDVGVVSISVAEGVSTLPASELDGLIGEHARVDLPAGSLPGRGSVGALPLTPGTSRVGLRLPAGRMPTSPMPAGTRISVVEVAEKSETQAAANASRSADAETPRSTDAVVVRAPVRAEDRTSWLLDVEVSADQAARLADLASRDRVAVIVRGP